MHRAHADASNRMHLSWVLGLALVSGGLHVLALPPYDQSLVAFFALVPLFYVLRVESRPGRLVAAASLFGLVSVVGVVHWIPEALILGNGFGSRAALILATLVFAYYTACFAVLPLVVRWIDRGVLAGPLASAIAWVAMEGVRDGLVPALSWTLYGHSQHDNLPLLQFAELAGAPGLSFVLVFVNALLAEAIVRANRGGLRRTGPAWPLCAAMLCVLGLYGGGWLRLAAQDRIRNSQEAMRIPVAAVQGAVAQSERWVPDQAWPRITQLLELTGSAAHAGAVLVVWPETSIEVHLDKADGLAEAISKTLSDYPGRMLLAGAPREVTSPLGSVFYNSAVLFDAKGATLDVYDKVLLYPGSERTPDWVLALPGAARILASQLRWVPYSPGSGEDPLLDGIVPIGVLICAEGIGPELARERVLAGAQLLVHLANDAVIPDRAATAQDFAISRFRAVETRRPLIRASNLGVSAVVGASGRILGRSAVGTPGIALASVVPQNGITPFVRVGWALPWLCIGTTILGGFLHRVPFSPARSDPPSSRDPDDRPEGGHRGT